MSTNTDRTVTFLDETADLINESGGTRRKKKNFDHLDEWKPRAFEEWIMFFRGDYGSEHKVAYPHKKSYLPQGDSGEFCECICNENPNIQCALHYYYKKDRNPKSTLMPKDYVAYNLIRLSYFHVLNKVGMKGNAYTTYVRCTDDREEVTGNTDCKSCLAGDSNRIFGRRAYLDAGVGFTNNLREVVRDIGRHCVNCDNKGIITLQWICRKCNMVLVDVASSTKSEEDVAKLYKTRLVCPKCGFSGIGAEKIACKNCSEPKRLGLFNTPICLKRQGERANSTIVLTQYVNNPVAAEEVKALMVPYDFESLFRITLADQLEILGRPNPFEQGGGKNPNAIQY